jgi:two-component system, sensor histidine kinase and response regulator
MVDKKELNAAQAEFDQSIPPEKLLCSEFSGARLLVVEDNPANRAVAEKLILAAGLKVDMAENGLLAVEKTSLTRYDLILMDVQMPTMNGLEATRAIRLLAGWADVPVLAMTASAFAEARSACLEAGMQDLVAKPLIPSELYATLLKWLSASVRKPGLGVVVPSIESQSSAQLLSLGGISGLDPGHGLATMRGNVAKYTAILSLFADECYRDAEKLSGLQTGTAFSEIERLTTSLRGNAAMLGAVKIAEAAGEVVSACHRGTATETTRTLCTVLIEELLRLADAIRGAIHESVAIAGPETEPEQLANVLTQLEALLEHGNIRANHLARNSAGLLQAAFGKSAKVFLAKIEAFEYESAVTELRQIRARLNGRED